MSNPFRRQATSSSATPGIHISHTSSVDTSQASTPTPESSNPPAPSTKVKKVRITSPPRSPPPDPYSPTEAGPLQQRVLAAHHGGSPPPQYADDSSSSDDDEPEDPFAREQSSGEESPVEVASRQPVATSQTRTASGAPMNPFSKTLASMEEPRRVQGQQEQGHQSTAEAHGGRTASKPAMDVDAFKNLLMTGRAPPSGAPAGVHSKVLTNLQGDSSSSTDTSSVSRQSLFDTLHEPHGETPRTSYELSISEDDDRATLIAEGSKAEKRKPPPPKHRHGKVVTPKGPQTVAFDDFSPNFSSPSTQSLPITISSSSPTKTTLPRTPTDLNKPLPPPPPRTSSDDSRPTPLDLKAASRPSPPAQSNSDPLTSPKKIPPAPPLARRSSQMRASNPVSSRPRSSTAASNLSQTGDDAGSYPPSIAESTTSSQVKMAPPPPPTRRSRAGTTDRPPSVDIPEPTFSNVDRRASMKSLPVTLSRQQSHQSSYSITSPPPPPPRRNSTRSSTDLGRPGPISPTGSSPASGEISRETFDEPRRTSTDVQEYVPMPIYEEPGEMDRAEKEELKEIKEDLQAQDTEPTTDQRDVLADMDAFQREIDELRERYSRGEG